MGAEQGKLERGARSPSSSSSGGNGKGSGRRFAALSRVSQKFKRKKTRKRNNKYQVDECDTDIVEDGKEDITGHKSILNNQPENKKTFKVNIGKSKKAQINGVGEARIDQNGDRNVNIITEGHVTSSDEDMSGLQPHACDPIKGLPTVLGTDSDHKIATTDINMGNSSSNHTKDAGVFMDKKREKPTSNGKSVDEKVTIKQDGCKSEDIQNGNTGSAGRQRLESENLEYQLKVSNDHIDNIEDGGQMESTVSMDPSVNMIKHDDQSTDKKKSILKMASRESHTEKGISIVESKADTIKHFNENKDHNKNKDLSENKNLKENINASEDTDLNGNKNFNEDKDIDENKDLTSNIPHPKDLKIHRTVSFEVCENEDQLSTGELAARKLSDVSAQNMAQASRKSTRPSMFGRKIAETLKKINFDNCEPDICVGLLKMPSMSTYSALNKKLKSCSENWMMRFLEEDGLEVLLDAVSALSSRRVSALSDAMTLLECIACIKTVMNSKMGLEFLVQNQTYTRRLVKGKKHTSFN